MQRRPTRTQLGRSARPACRTTKSNRRLVVRSRQPRKERAACVCVCVCVRIAKLTTSEFRAIHRRRGEIASPSAEPPSFRLGPDLCRTLSRSGPIKDRKQRLTQRTDKRIKAGPFRALFGIHTRPNLVRQLVRTAAATAWCSVVCVIASRPTNGASEQDWSLASRPPTVYVCIARKPTTKRWACSACTTA